MNLDIRKIYQNRFTIHERVRKKQLWQILVKDFLQQFVYLEDVIVDVGAGNCEFINHIHARQKIALDLNPDVKKYAAKGVEVNIGSISQVYKHFKNRKVTAFFLSNLLEHLESKEEVFRLLLEMYKVLPVGGRVLIMQPDISRIGESYWDFFDHKVALTRRSVIEVLETVGFSISYLRAPFLPYTVKYRHYPLSRRLFRLYLRLRPLQYIFGKQFFVCAVKGTVQPNKTLKRE